ncbi:MAG: sarcosine oxidase subunit alpha family protein [Pseudomonadota bacterium]
MSYRVGGRGRVSDRPVTFTFDGRRIEGRAGDTVASALLANGIHLAGRSFKYHRPRGILTAGSEEPNALLQVRRGPGRAEPNTRATVQEIHPGLETESQNRWPSLRVDALSINDRLSPVFAAGFYYKTFMWPKAFWDRVYEPVIRAAAGLGRAPAEPDPDRYASRYLHTDVLVVGGGPAGLAAARAAALPGVRVTLVDETAEFGGALLSEPGTEVDGRQAWAWLEDELTALAAMGVRLMSRTTAIGYYHENMIALAERVTDHLEAPHPDLPRERLWRVRAGQVILAQGAHEKPLVFNGNDRPGVMLAGAARTYLNRYGVRPGDRAAVITSHDSAYAAAFDLAGAGTAIAAIIDTRLEPPAELLSAAAERGIPVRVGHTVTGTDGRLRVSAVRAAPVQDGRPGFAVRIPCDCVLMCGGWTPALSLFSHSRGTLLWDAEAETFLPDRSPEACRMVGGARGLWGIGAALADGAEAGAAAVAALGRTSAPSQRAVTGDAPGTGQACRELPTDRPNPRAFVDFQNDVTAKDIRLAVREGMRSIEHVKRYTTSGMATDQGKSSNINALMIAADAIGRSAPEVGLTTFRPPYTPVTFGAIAGHHRDGHFEVTRKTPIDGWAEASGAVFEPVGQWRRAWYVPRAGEDMEIAVLRECAAVREAVGMFDASTLGKIEVVGPDAAEFLNRMYTNPWTKLGVGRCRYGLLLGEDGYIRDDGVIGRLAPDLFHVTTTTGGAARVMNTMEDYLQTEWPELRVWLTSTTEQWAVIAVNGPKAREVIAPLVEGLDLSPEAFPHMSVAETTVAGVPARLFRISFTGELGFEINVPARHGRAVWDKVAAAGADHGITPYGTESMHVLRAEKGYIIVGQDTDGTVTPADAGLSWAIGKKKPDFVGKRSLARPDLVAAGRRELVGLLADDKLEEGAQIVLDPSEPLPMTMVGHVTSSYRSAALGRPIALALLADGHSRMGERVHIPMPGATLSAEVTSPVFYDPDGDRLKL